MKRTKRIGAGVVISVALAFGLLFASLFLLFGASITYGHSAPDPFILTIGPLGLAVRPFFYSGPHIFRVVAIATPFLYACYSIALLWPSKRSARIKTLGAIAMVHYVPAFAMIIWLRIRSPELSDNLVTLILRAPLSFAAFVALFAVANALAAATPKWAERTTKAEGI